MERLKENRNSIFTICILIIIMFFIIATICFNKSIKAYTGKEIEFSDNKNIDYNVNLKDNQYFENEKLEKEKQYIAKLIDTIESNFKYNLKIENDEEYNYTYKIVADVNVVDDKTKKSLYSYSEDLITENTGKAIGSLNIDENVSINYDKYNDKIEKFINSYELNNVTSTVSLNLYLGIDGINQEFSKSNVQVMSLEIPLATNTISISTNYNNLSDENSFKIATINNGKLFLIIGIIFAILDLVVFITSAIFMKLTSNDVEKYNKELKNIVNNYEPYISKVKEEFNMEGYQILNVDSFIDLLEIRDTMRIPIIMIENKTHLVTCFIIPTPNKILYSYTLSTSKFALPSGKHSSPLEEKV